MKIRCKTNDIAYQYRMTGGFPGDVSRTHPATIEPVLIDASAPPQFYGEAVLVDGATQGVRPFTTTDTAVTAAYGVLVRPYPFQQSSGSNYGAASIGAATPPASGAADALRAGYISVTVPAGQTPVKDGAVYVWCAASTGGHIQGGFEASASNGNTAALTNCTFNGSPDANGNVELAFNI